MTAKQFDHVKQLARNMTPDEMADVCYQFRNALLAMNYTDPRDEAVACLSKAAHACEHLARTERKD